jgi:chaperone modulatory protein CbpM
MTNLIATTDICTYHEVEYTFITSLQEAGLVELRVVDKATYIPESDLQKLERMIRLHHELEINIAGIEAITHLLERVEQMQEEMRVLRNRV